MSAAVGIVGRGNVRSTLVKEWQRRFGSQQELLVCSGAAGAGAGPIETGGTATEVSLEEMARRAGIIIIEAEPAETLAVLASLRSSLAGEVSLVIVGADRALAGLRAAVGPRPSLFRMVVTPETGSGDGVAILCTEAGASQATVSAVSQVLACAGLVAVVPEDMLEAAAAVTGSTIGFLALALEGVEDGAVKEGLPRDTARAFARQTALTAARLLQDHAGSPADLKDQVASPGGTTIAGLAALEDQAVRGAAIRAVERAVEWSRAPRDAGGAPVVE